MAAALPLQSEAAAGAKPAPTRRSRAVAFGTAAPGGQAPAPAIAAPASRSGNSAAPVQYTRGSLIDIQA
jgi:hypothetical protein